MQKVKVLSEEALQIAVKRREAKGKGEMERYIYLNAEFQRIERKDKNPDARQKKRHRCIEESFGLCGRGRGWDDLGESH